MTDRVTAIRAELTPIVESLGLSVYDVTLTGGDRPTLALLVDRAGERGIDLDELETATRTVSAALDAMDPVHGRYLLEVSSPGLERPLRTPAHFRRAVGQQVAVRTNPGVEGERRVAGLLTTADDEGIVVTTSTKEGTTARTLRYADIERARTVFEWGSPPKAGARRKPTAAKEAAR